MLFYTRIVGNFGVGKDVYNKNAAVVNNRLPARLIDQLMFPLLNKFIPATSFQMITAPCPLIPDLGYFQ